MYRSLRLWVGALLFALLTACGDDKPPSDYHPEYGAKPALSTKTIIFAVHPLHNPETLNAVYGPLMRYLSDGLTGITIQLEASRDYDDFEQKLAQRRFHFALPNPYQTLMSLRWGYRIFAKMGDDDQFRGLLIARKDHSFAQPQDLKGKTIAYPAPTALAATMMPQMYLHEHGLDVIADTTSRYVGSQESALLNAYTGLADIAATWPPPWRKFQMDEPEKARQMTVLWTTSSLPNNGVVARDDVPPEIVERIKARLLDMPNSAEGRAILARIPLSGFEPATEATYTPVRAFLKQFSATVRPIEMPR